MEDYRLGVVETRFAELIWSHEPLTSGELVKLCAKELEWKKSTTYVDKLLDGEKTRYVFQINAPFEDTSDAANVYAATFDFDAEGNFIDVYLQINILRDDAYTLGEFKI